MIKFFVRKDKDDSILCSRILEDLDEIPSVMIDFLKSINCHTEILITPDSDDREFWKLRCFEQAADNAELLSD